MVEVVEVRVSRLFARQRHSVRTGCDVVRRGGEHDDPRPSPEEGLQVVHEQTKLVEDIQEAFKQLDIIAHGDKETGGGKTRDLFFPIFIIR